MHKEQAIQQRLWDYIDGLCSPTEKAAIESLLSTDPEWQQQYEQLQTLHHMLQQSELEAPSMRFTKNVMEKISRTSVTPAAQSYINKNIIRGIGAFFLTILGALLVYCFKQYTPSPTSNTVAIPNLGLDKFNYSRILNNTYTTAFILIATIGGLVLLDAWLRRKKHSTT